MPGIPFRVEVKTGEPVHDQVVFAVQKAILAGQLRAGDAFPSVRVLSQALRINPNTAHRVVQTLVTQGALVVRPGVGTLVGEAGQGTKADRRALLEGELERAAVEGRRLGLTFEEVRAALERHWKGLGRR